MGAAAGWNELGHHRTAVSHKDVLAPFDRPHDLAQPILELPNAHGLHSRNVATWGHIVNY